MTTEQMKNLPNNTLLGYDSISDLFTTLFGKDKLGIGILSFIGGVTSLISNYVYENAQAVYFLVVLMACDLVTAIYRSYKTKTFSSKRLPRVLVTLLAYCLLLAVSWNASKYAPVFTFLPGMLYSGFVGVLIVSVAENLMQAGLLPKDMYMTVKEKLSFFKKKKDGNE